MKVRILSKSNDPNITADVFLLKSQSCFHLHDAVLLSLFCFVLEFNYTLYKEENFLFSL